MTAPGALPPLRDAHVHLPDHGAFLSCVNLSDCAGVDDALQRIARAADADARAGTDGWIRCVSARVEGWRERAWPSARQIDQAARGRPCFLRSFDHHSVMVGAAGLHAAGIAPGSPDPAGGVIVREADAPHAAPTGLLLENACNLLWDALPKPSAAERREHVRLALRDLRARGFVEVHDMLSHAWLGKAVAHLLDEGDPDATAVRVWLYAPAAEIEPALERAEEWSRDTLRLAGAKAFLDGTLNSRTAWMLHPYPDPLPGMPRGKPMLTPDELDALVSRCDILGAPLAMHAIGDAAVRAALDAVERASPSTLGFRVEHCEFVDEADCGRFARLGVIASVQPCHLLPDMEALAAVTPHRRHRAFPLREIMDHCLAAGYEPGELVWFGSDTPVVPPSYDDNVQAAVHRRRGGMPEHAAVAPDQALTPEECLACQIAPDDGPA